jgi:hypothetical protein
VIRRSWRTLSAGLAFLTLLAGQGAVAQTPERPVTITARAIPLMKDRSGAVRVGELTYAGGLVLEAPGETAFGGLSGLDVRPDGSFVSQSDAGDLFRGRLMLDGRRRLVGVADASVARLTDESGQPYGPRKSSADAEDITLLPDGGFAVSFEQRHRVQAYAGLGPARRLGVPAEAAGFPPNTGLEALAAWTDGDGRPHLVEGSEDGRAWICDIEGRDCRRFLDQPPEKDFSLTGFDALPGGLGLVAVYRAVDLVRGIRALVAWVRPETGMVSVLAHLAAPANVDNMEGIAALPNPDGSIRLYLISDDNFSRLQRTLLLAFDWRK